MRDVELTFLRFIRIKLCKIFDETHRFTSHDGNDTDDGLDS